MAREAEPRTLAFPGRAWEREKWSTSLREVNDGANGQAKPNRFAAKLKVESNHVSHSRNPHFDGRGPTHAGDSPENRLHPTPSDR